MNTLEELMKYSVSYIKSHIREKNNLEFFPKSSTELNDPTVGLIEIQIPREYKGRKKRIGMRLKEAIIEFYKKQGFKLIGTPETYIDIDKTKKRKGLHFERQINFLEKYLVSVERQGIHFYIHVKKGRE